MSTRTLLASAASVQDAATTVALLARYYLVVLPQARRELRYWETRARTIPDPHLRRQAVATLREEMMNAEAATVFATTAPRACWSAVVRMLVAFQVMYDYLDTIGEERVDDPLRNGLQLHKALVAALDPLEPIGEWYRFHLWHDDGGYLDELVTTCRECLATLPAAGVIGPVARRAATRCGEGQSYTHAAIQDSTCDLAAWSLTQADSATYLWWEISAGTISSVGVEALLAAAADPRTTAEESERIDAAYFPSMCALSTLLDSFVDHDSDLITGNHNSFGLYTSPAQAIERLALIAECAETGVRGLRHARRHAAILAGIAGYYLSAEGADTPAARPIAAAIVDRLGPMVPLILATMRLRRHVAATRAGAASPAETHVRPPRRRGAERLRARARPRFRRAALRRRS